MTMELALPATGELIDLENASQCATALFELRELENRIRDVKRVLTEALLAESSRVGTKTMHIEGGLTAVVSDTPQVVWDVEALEKLLKAGLPEARYNELVTAEVTYKVNAAVAKSIAGTNPRYARIIKKARTEIPKAPTVSVKVG